MPVLSKETHQKMLNELNDRFGTLKHYFTARELVHNREGLKNNRLYWKKPEAMCATHGSDMMLRVAVRDFVTFLKEIEKLK